MNIIYKKTHNYGMLVFIRVLVLVYFLSVNFYGFLLIKFQKKKRVEDCKSKVEQENNNQPENNIENKPNNTPLLDDTQKEEQPTLPCDKKLNSNCEEKMSKCENQISKVSDGKLILTGALGGALGIYIAMFVYKYRLTNFFLMVVMPVFIATYIYLLVVCFTNNFGIIQEVI